MNPLLGNFSENTHTNNTLNVIHGGVGHTAVSLWLSKHLMVSWPDNEVLRKNGPN
jgi:hypothetical protein